MARIMTHELIEVKAQLISDTRRDLITLKMRVASEHLRYQKEMDKSHAELEKKIDEVLDEIYDALNLIKGNDETG